MKAEKLCSPQNYSVLIPYRDLEQLLQLANNLQHFDRELNRIEKRIEGLHLLYSQLLEKVAEIDRYL